MFFEILNKLQIESKKDESLTALERLVTVKGNPDACWRVSVIYIIYYGRQMVHILGWEMQDRMAAETGALKVGNRSNFEANSVANRKPMQIGKDRCDVFVRPPEQEYSLHAEGESDLKRRFQTIFAYHFKLVPQKRYVSFLVSSSETLRFISR